MHRRGFEVLERERKYLVADRSILEGHPHSLIVQGYLFVGHDSSIRVRRERSGGIELPPFLAVKGPVLGGAREKFEMEISVALAGHLMLAALGKVVKLRHQLMGVDGEIWTIDHFQLDHEGLILAELEVGPEGDPGSLPQWCGDEVTADQRFRNESLALDSNRFYAQ